MPCWLLTNTAVTSAVMNFQCHKLIAKVNYQKNGDMLSTENIKICGGITKLEAIRIQYAAFSSISAEYLQKFEFLISQGILATCLRWGGRCHMSFVANFIRFSAVQTFWESVKIWQSYREFKGGNFFEAQCRYTVNGVDLNPHILVPKRKLRFPGHQISWVRVSVWVS